MRLSVSIAPWQYNDQPGDEYEFTVTVNHNGQVHRLKRIVLQEPWESLLDMEFDVARREIREAMKKAA